MSFKLFHTCQVPVGYLTGQISPMNYIALLRGINVGGHKKIKMAELRQELESSGLTNVQTYIQSGNITFESQATKAELEAQIKKVILNNFSFEVPVVIRTAEEWRHIVQKVPYDVENYLNQIYVVFLHQPPKPQDLSIFSALSFDQDVFSCIGQQIYIRYTARASNSKLTLAIIEKYLKVSGTARNWKTVKQMSELVKD